MGRKLPLRRLRFKGASPAVRVGPSQIHGKGVFATSGLPAGTPLIDQHLQKNLKEYEQGEKGWDGKLTIYVGGKLLGSSVSSWQEFINHQDEPNAKFNTKAELVTTKPVSAGDEITVDYRTCVHPQSRVYRELFGGKKEPQ